MTKEKIEMLIPVYLIKKKRMEFMDDNNECMKMMKNAHRENRI